MSQQEAKFWNIYHETLFALFIVEANNLFSRQFKPRDAGELVSTVILTYYNSWEDRAVARPEFEGMIEERCPWNPFLSRTVKIKYTYSDYRLKPLEQYDRE